MPIAIKVEEQAVLHVGQKPVAVAVDAPRGQDAVQFMFVVIIFVGPHNDRALEVSGRGITERLPAGAQAEHDWRGKARTVSFSTTATSSGSRQIRAPLDR